MFQSTGKVGRFSYFPWEAIVPVAFLFLTLRYSPYLQQFEVQTDEGFNLAKASLLKHGYPLYTLIWSDQPPVFTYLLCYAFRIFDASVIVGRMVTLFLSCVLLWAAALCVRLVFGRTHAVVAGILIVSLPLYLKLSNAVMVGLPAIAFAMSSLAAITLWHLRRRPIWLVLSGSTLAISVFTKGFTGILVPIFCVGIIVDGYAHRGATDPRQSAWSTAWSSFALWLAAFFVVAGSLFMLLVGPIGAEQLVWTHLMAMRIADYQQQAPDFTLSRYFGTRHWTLVLAIVGTILACLKKKWLCMYMVGWAFSAFILLFLHRPVWSHHQLLVTVPAAPLAAIVIAELMLCMPRALRSKQMAFAGKLVLAGVAGGIALWCITLTTLPATAKTLRRWILAKSTPVDAAHDELLAQLRKNAHGSDWLVTDRPMYAFRAGLMVPPYVAVISRKRLVTGGLTEGAIISTIREVRPTQVLLGRFQLPALRVYLRQHYHLIYSQNRRDLYVKNCKSSACLEIPDDWRSDEAVRIGDNLLLFQRDTGGWPKNIDMAVELTPASKSEIARAQARRDDSTIDNGATTTQMRYLARLYNATKADRFKAGFLKGLDYLLNAQYENGAWPQVYPINPSKYSARITFNDDAMTNVLMLLHDIISGNQDFAFVDKARLDRAAVALQKGIEIVLKTQIVVNGKRTAWAQQYDENTLVPRPARTYELESISGRESVTIVRFLMSLEKPSPEVVEAIQSAIAWFEQVKLVGIRVVEKRDPALPRGFDRVVVKDPNAPPIWARFYEIGTNQPFFVGSDGVKKHSLAEIEAERRSGYDYYVDAPASLLAKDYPAWREKRAR